MLKEKLKQSIEKKEKQLADLRERSKRSEDIKELCSLNEDINTIIGELNDLKEMYGEADEPAPAPTPDGRSLNPLKAMEQRAGTPAEADDPHATIQYREEFRKYVLTGERPTEYRDSTKTTDVSPVVPTNLLNQILEKWEQLGTIYPLVTKTNYKVGQTIPTEGVKPTATWVNEGAGSTAQKTSTFSTITFTHFKLRCEVRYTEEVANMALPAFESWLLKKVDDAMLRALEAAIYDGNGTSQPKGILTETPNSGQALTLAAGAANKITYQVLCDAEAAIPVQYEAGAKWFMTKKTFMKFVGMTDSAGQPIARVNYGLAGKPERTLLGRDVVLVVPQADSKLKDYEDANKTADLLFAFIVDPSDYVLNMNYNLGVKSAQDWDTEDHKTKAVLGCDGKLIVKDSLVTITKTKSPAA